MTTSAKRWTMSAVGQPLLKETFELAPAAAGEVTVEIAGCGVCHTDLGYYYQGVRTHHALPLALGHEISGRVIAVGSGAESWLGRAVIIPAVIPCGKCDLCRRGKGTICPNQKMPGNDIQGGFATHITVPAHGLCPVDESRLKKAGLSLADVAVVADAVTTPYQAVIQAGVQPATLAVVNGVGGVGGYCAQIATALGATVVAIDVDPKKLDAIATARGAAKTINAQEVEPKDIRKVVGAFAKERGLPSKEWTIFECSGTAAGQQTAFGLLVHGATLAVVGFTMDKVEIRLSNLMAFHARALGNWGCAPELYPAALDLVLDGQIELRNFVEQHPMDSINEVFAEVHAHRLSRRPVLVPQVED
jgi:6-hydroxycyclohex-1-ene-1-carbonyl-CoA dehydrogenase